MNTSHSDERNTPRFQTPEALQKWLDSQPDPREAAQLIKKGKVWRGTLAPLLAQFPRPTAPLVTATLERGHPGVVWHLASNPNLQQKAVNRIARWGLKRLTGDWSQGEWVLKKAARCWGSLGQTGHRPEDDLIDQLVNLLNRQGPNSILASCLSEEFEHINSFFTCTQYRQILANHPNWMIIRRGLASHHRLREEDGRWLLEHRKEGGSLEVLAPLAGQPVIRNQPKLLMQIAQHPRIDIKATVLPWLEGAQAELVARQMIGRNVETTIEALDYVVQEQGKPLPQAALAELVNQCPHSYQQEIIRAAGRWGGEHT